MILNKINKVFDLLHKLQNLLPQNVFITNYKSFIRLHLDYCDIFYNQTFNYFFHQKLEPIQFNAWVAITEAIRDSSKDKLYQELGLDSLQYHRWQRELCCFYKMYEKTFLSFQPNPKENFILLHS